MSATITTIEPVHMTGNPGSISYPIGRVHVPAGTTIDRGFQYACDWQEVEWDAQDAIVWSNGYYASWGVTARVVREYFGRGEERPVGKTRKFSWSPYLYDWGRAYADGELPDVTLLPEYSVRVSEVPMQSDPSRSHRFGELYVAGDHPVSVERVWGEERIYGGQAWNRSHAYVLLIRGQAAGCCRIHERDGWNGNTFQVAMRRAAMLMPELVA